MFDRLKEYKPFRLWLLPIGWGSFICIVSLIPRLNLGAGPIQFEHIDKVYHFLAYCLFAILIGRSIYRAEGAYKKEDIIFTLITASAYGILMELLQGFVPARDPNIYDAAVNIFGITVGITLGRLILWRK